MGEEGDDDQPLSTQLQSTGSDQKKNEAEVVEQQQHTATNNSADRSYTDALFSPIKAPTSLTARGLTNRLNEALQSLNASLTAAQRMHPQTPSQSQPHDSTRTPVKTAPVSPINSNHDGVITGAIGNAVGSFPQNHASSAQQPQRELPQTSSDKQEGSATEQNAVNQVQESLKEQQQQTECVHHSVFPLMTTLTQTPHRDSASADSNLVLPDACRLCKESISEIRQHHLKLQRLSKEKEAVEGKASEMEKRCDQQAQELCQLRADLQSLSAKLVHEVERRAELQAERDRFSEELEELTRSLFEQANGMVAVEAKRRHQLELDQQRAQLEVKKLQNQLEQERLHVLWLRRRLSGPIAVSVKGTGLVEEAAPTSSDDGALPFLPPLFQLDPITALQVDLLPDCRLFDLFKSYVEKLPSLPLHKLLNGHSFIKACFDEHMDPCARLPKLSCKKVIEAIMNGTIRLQEALEESEEATQEETKTDVELSPSSTAPPVTSVVPAVPPVAPPAPRPSIADSASSTSVASTGRHASPPRPQFWNSFNAPPPNDRSLCGGCGRDVPCHYQLTLNTPPAIWIDGWCRDRIQSVWDVVRFLLHLQKQAQMGEEGLDLRTAYVQFLKHLFDMFYARLGVVPYFRRAEQHLQLIETLEMAEKHHVVKDVLDRGQEPTEKDVQH